MAQKGKRRISKRIFCFSDAFLIQKILNVFFVAYVINYTSQNTNAPKIIIIIKNFRLSDILLCNILYNAEEFKRVNRRYNRRRSQNSYGEVLQEAQRKEWAWFFENLYDVAERDLRERIAENKADVHAKCDFSLMGKGMAEVKYSYEILQELIDTLRNEQGHALYSGNWINPTYENKYITGIKKRISNTDWNLELCRTYGNVWNWEKGKRIYKEHDVARLIDSKGTELIFDLPDDLNPKDDPETIHVHNVLTKTRKSVRIFIT